MTVVRLVSKDEATGRYCRELLPEVFGTEWSLLTGPPAPGTSETALCIWDYRPGETAVPRDLEAADLKRHWFMLDRKDQAGLESAVGTTKLNLILKPVTPAALRAFLCSVKRQGNERNDGPASAEDQLRVERDEMLQFLTMQTSNCRKAIRSGIIFWRARSTIFSRLRRG
jgi:hypothetical protein